MSSCSNPESPEEIAHSQKSAALGAAVGLESTLIDHDLQAIIDTWPALPDEAKANILAMVRAANSDNMLK